MLVRKKGKLGFIIERIRPSSLPNSQQNLKEKGSAQSLVFTASQLSPYDSLSASIVFVLFFFRFSSLPLIMKQKQQHLSKPLLNLPLSASSSLGHFNFPLSRKRQNNLVPLSPPSLFFRRHHTLCLSFTVSCKHPFPPSSLRIYFALSSLLLKLSVISALSFGFHFNVSHSSR